MPKFEYQGNIKDEYKQINTIIEQGSVEEFKKLINPQKINETLDTKNSITFLLIATYQAKPAIVAALLEMPSLQMEYESASQYTALGAAIYYAGTNHEGLGNEYRKIALLLIKKKSNLFHSGIDSGLAQLKNEDDLSILIKKLREYSKSGIENLKTGLASDIAQRYESLGEMEECYKWLALSSNKAPFYLRIKYLNYSISQGDFKKSYAKYEEMYFLSVLDEDRKKIISELKKISEGIEEKENKNDVSRFEANMTLGRIYTKQEGRYLENRKLAISYFHKAEKIVSNNHQIQLDDGMKAFFEAINFYRKTILVKENVEEEKSNFSFNENDQDFTEEMWAQFLLSKAAMLKSDEALECLIKIAKEAKTSHSLFSCYLLKSYSNPSIFSKLPEHCHQLFDKNMKFIEGLEYLHGLSNKPVNALRAVVCFEQVAQGILYKSKQLITMNEKQFLGDVYIQIILSHAHAAQQEKTDKLKSERIEKIISAYKKMIEFYPVFSSDSKKNIFQKLFSLIAVEKNEKDQVFLLKTLLNYYQNEIQLTDPDFSLLKGVFSVLMNVKELLKIEIWMPLLDTLSLCYEKGSRITRELIILQLNKLDVLAEKLPLQSYHTKKVLADCHSLSGEEEKSLELAIQYYESATNFTSDDIEEKLNPQSYRDVYKRLGDVKKKR